MNHRWPHHVARTLLLVATAAPWCHAQDPAPQPAPTPAPRATAEVLRTLRQQLQTQPPGATVACGAWAAAEASARELVPELTAALRRTLDAPRDAATPFVQLALLDALIRLDAQVPTEDLAALARVQNVRAQTLVLASRDAKRHAAALEALHADVDHLERLATDYLLAAAAPARAVALLLPEVEVRLKVSVVDPGDFESESSSFGLTSACGYITVPGFPPHGSLRTPSRYGEGRDPGCRRPAADRVSTHRPNRTHLRRRLYRFPVRQGRTRAPAAAVPRDSRGPAEPAQGIHHIDARVAGPRRLPRRAGQTPGATPAGLARARLSPRARQVAHGRAGSS